jgi:hypothetical protein
VPAIALLLAAAASAPAVAQARTASEKPESSPAVQELERELARAREAHLRRVAWWGGANLLVGVALAATAGAEAPTRRGFGVQTAAWGGINLGIAAWGALAAGPTGGGGLAAALASEDRWAHILLVNLGLNVGYMAVGGALWIASKRGLRSGDAVRGHAAAVVLQGAGLLVLDGVAWLSSSRRLDALREIVESVSLSVGPAAGSLSVGASFPLG